MVSIVEAIPHPTMLNTTITDTTTTRRVNPPPMYSQGSRSRSASQLPELTRGSFAHHCLQTVVSKMGIEIQIEYFEKEDGIFTKVLETLVSAKDIPLSQSLQEDKSLAEKIQEVSSGSTHIIRCYAGDITGEEIELTRHPNDIEYILEALRNHSKPVVILCKEPLTDSPTPPITEEDEQMIGYTGRTASGMVQEMFSLSVNYRTSRHKSDSDRDSMPSTPGSSQHDSVFSLEEELEDTLSSSLQLAGSRGSPSHGHHHSAPKVHTLSSSLSMWRMPEELYDCQEEFLPLDSGRESDHESDAESTISSISVRSSSKESTSSSNGAVLSSEESATSLTKGPKGGRFSPELGGSSSGSVMKGQLEALKSDLGYCTLPHPPRNGAKAMMKKGKMPAALKRITIIANSKKRKSVSADITSPSPAHTSSSPSPAHTPTSAAPQENVSWSGRRQNAIRRTKLGSGRSDQLQPVIHESSYSFQVQSVTVVFRDSVKMDIVCREFYTVMEVKDAIAQQLNKQDPDRYTPWKASDLILSYKKEGVEYELYNEWQFLYRTSVYESWAQSQETGSIPLLVDAAAKGKPDDLSIIYRISQLAGVVMDDKIASLPGADIKSLRKIAPPDRKEAKWARRTLHNFVDEVARSRDPEEYSLSIELVSSTTSTILALKIPIDSKIKIVFHYKQCFSLVKHIKVQRTAESVLKEIFPCLVACGLVEDNMDAYTMQISGERSYIAGNHDLIEFKDIRRCITKGEPVHISIAEKPSPDKDKPCGIKWLPIDPLSGEPPLHGDITSSNLANQDKEMQALSVWDREDPFTLRVLKADNLPLVSSKNLPNVIVDATLYHGEKPLCTPVTTSAQLLSLSVSWSETLNFKMAKRDIPKSAKILFRISEPLQRKDSSATKNNLKSTKFLYWGLTALFDHQGMMYNGERVISLWKGKKEDKKETDIEDYQMPNPCGPASNNSDPKAVQLHIKFDSYGFPMYFPSCTSPSWSVVLSQQKNTNVAVRRQFNRLLDYIRQGKLHSAVPAYIQKVNWGSLLETLEVYSLLEEIHDTKDKFPAEVALKLLDCEFPDEKVRHFSTKVLEQMPDEKLEDFLLQLTQALKFEPNHDSSLARFLLKRAVRNKRIGHFFFWYLKCEMYNPQYTTRFGVIMEAYLKGCGESMLKQFEDQVEMQTTLERIGLKLKQKCNDDHSRMQALLPEALEGHGIPQFVITSVYNPRIRLGNLRPNKCKIMASKKKPQWLEMSNIDPTVLIQTPTRLILKIGDDLRQDMITLRMFSLFEKLWEEEGLDLALIPYGCIATGPNTGFIEVVKNARTIAEVSGLNNQTKLLDWIKSHQKNEFGEVDPDKLKAAVKMFVHSCAGYSVATYVLGIGDRHNDNIMVTTSGNLFHIDFGHFLGNIKYIMGFKREWAPFVLTPDFVWVMGGEDSSTFETYKNLCCRAFLILRRHSDLIINLFSLMRSTGIPELTCVEDTDYIRNALVLDKSEHEAEQMFRKVIKKCLDLKYTVQLMWRFHLLRKKGSS